jgi:hypothetical protein
MKLVGKRVERLNSFGDSLAIQLRDEGQMRLSPALMSRLKVTADNNKIGIAYPDEGEKDLHIYVAPDGDGVAVNKQGYIKNIPHNRDLRSHMDLSSTGEEDLYICEEAIAIPEHPGYTFYKIVLDTYDEWDNVEMEDNTSEGEERMCVSVPVENDIQEEDTVENHTDDSQEVEETDNETVKEDKENDEKFEDFDLI